MGSLSDEDRDLTEIQVDKNEGVSIFFGRRPIESVINSVVKRCNSIPNQFVEESSSGASPGAVARKAAFFDRYIRTVSMEKARQGEADVLDSDPATGAVAAHEEPNLEVGPLDEYDGQIHIEETATAAIAFGPSEKIQASIVVEAEEEAVEASSSKEGASLMIERASTNLERVPEAKPDLKPQTKPNARAGKLRTPSTVTAAPAKTGSKPRTELGVSRSRPTQVRVAGADLRAQVTVETARRSSPRPVKDRETSNGVKREPRKTTTSSANALACNANGFNFRSKERAEKRKEFKLRTEEKHHAREAEKNKLQAKTQEETQAKVREFRKALNFRATPMPSFYQEVQANSGDGVTSELAAPRTPTPMPNEAQEHNGSGPYKPRGGNRDNEKGKHSR